MSTAVHCDRCGSEGVRQVYSDDLRSTPAIFECANPACSRREFRVLRLRGRIVHCGEPGEFTPRNMTHSAIRHANRERAMEHLPSFVELAIGRGGLRGLEYV